MASLYTLVLVFGLPSLILGQIVLPGDCPKYATQSRFNPAQVITQLISLLTRRSV